MLGIVEHGPLIRLRCQTCGYSTGAPRSYALNFPAIRNIMCSKCWNNDKREQEEMEAEEHRLRGIELRAQWAKEPKPVYELKEIPPIVIKPKKPEQGRLL